MYRFAIFCCACLLIHGMARGDETLSACPSGTGSIVSITVSRPTEREVVEFADFNSTVEAAETAAVTMPVAGQIVKVHFKSGAEVHKGDVLFEIDAGPEATAAVKLKHDCYQAPYGTPYGTYSSSYAPSPVDAAQRSAAAQAALAKLEASRSVSKPQEYTKILAPISGQIDRMEIDPDGLVTTHATLAKIEAIDSLHIGFFVDELSVLKIREMSANRSKPGSKTLEGVHAACAIAGEDGFPRLAVIETMANHSANGCFTIYAVARLDNSARLFSPGMSARLRLTISKPFKALVVPANAVVSQSLGSPYRGFVHVVNDKHVIEGRCLDWKEVVDGDTRLICISSGLTAKDKVVVTADGALENGMNVR
jgi:membrane fusion protein, multidrug efflux system